MAALDTEQLPIRQARIDVTGTGDTTVVAAVTAKRIRLIGFGVVVSLGGSASWKSGASTTLIGPMVVAANAELHQVAPRRGHILETAVGEALVFNLSAGAAQGWVNYVLSD